MNIGQLQTKSKEGVMKERLEKMAYLLVTMLLFVAVPIFIGVRKSFPRVRI